MTYKVEADPGTMKHTFTGLRPEFANLLIHEIIRSAIIPLRVELMRRTENDGEGILSPALRTTILQGLQHIRSQFQENANTKEYDPLVTLKERLDNKHTYINTVLNKANTAEIQSRKADFTHADEVLLAADSATHSVTFDYTGLLDRDMAQPSPERVQNFTIRALIIGLDKLIVKMTQSHSRANPRTILAEEAALWITDLDNIYHMIDSYDAGVVPFYPTAQSLNEKDRQFNFDGTYDVEFSAGVPNGSFDSNDRVVAPDGPVETKIGPTVGGSNPTP